MRLTTPSSQITSSTKRQQARLLSSMSLVLGIASLITTPVWVLTAPGFATAPWIGGGVALSYVFIYLLSRTHRYLLGVALMIVAALMLVISTLITAPGPLIERMLALKFLLITSLLSSFFLNRTVTILLSALNLAISGMFFFIPEVPTSFALSYFVFLAVIPLLGAVGAVLGDTYRKRLNESEERYRSIFAVIPNGIVVQKQGGAIEACNTEAERILGLTRDQMLGRTSMDPRWRTIHEDGSPLTGEDHPAMITLKTGLPQFGVVMGVHTPEGALRWLSINSQPLFQPGEAQPYAAVTSFADISEAKRHQRELAEAQRRYRGLFEQTHDAVFIMSLDGEYVDANQRGAEMLGFSIDEIKRMTIAELSAEVNDSAQIRQRLQAGERVPPYEREIFRKDGSVIQVDINVELVRDLDGRPLHLQAVVRDITERAQVRQRDFELTLEKERVRLLSQFIEKASHEFRTPLAVINSVVFALARTEDADQRLVREAKIKDQVARMTRLVDMLLEMNKLESGLEEISHIPVDLDGVIQIAIDSLNRPAGKGPAIRFEKQTSLPFVMGDRHALIEAVQQVIDNAVRFTPEDGQITVSTGTANRRVWVEVRDTGQGIAAEDLPHIFETFWRHDEMHTTPGMGLGLPITRRIVEMHGGSIEVESEPGKGSVFRIVLPAPSLFE
ncbi:MAG: PAS domain S-box protein [Anaerolineae bacterium]|nr:PAS domain S-box protein [Anaerolineae bacterium]